MKLTEQQAWHILEAYAHEVFQLGSPDLLAVFTIGSLAGGYYRPGQSDLDAVLVLRDGSDIPSSPDLVSINRKYEETYAHQTGFESIPVFEGIFISRSDDGLLFNPQLNARMKLQSCLLAGNYDLDSIPMPTRQDWRIDVSRLEADWQAAGGDAQLLRMGAKSIANHALMRMRQYLVLCCERICFNKFNLVEIYIEQNLLYRDKSKLRLLWKQLDGQTLDEADVSELRKLCLRMHKKVIQALALH